MVLKGETLIVKAIIQYIKSMGGDAFHVSGNGLQRVGEPDIDGWIPLAGLPLAFRGVVHLKLECKGKNGVVSPLQMHRINQYKEANYVAGITHSIEDVKALLNAYKNTALEASRGNDCLLDEEQEMSLGSGDGDG